MTFDVLPAIDLHDGGVVRLVQGDFGQATRYGADPVTVAAGFVVAGARWIHVVDLDGAKAGRPVHGPIVEAITRAVGEQAQVEVGGGLRDEAAVEAALRGGAARVVLGTSALRDGGLIRAIIDRRGAERVAIAVDVRDGRVVGDAWQGRGEAAPDALVDRLVAAGAAIFEVTAIDRDGTFAGPDLALLGRLARRGVGSVIASGGVRSIDDLARLRDAGCAGAIVGRALYEGRIDLATAVARFR